MWPISDRMRRELQKPVHQTVSKIQFLNTNFVVQREVRQLSLNPSDNLIDGTVDVDITRQTRRTLTMSLLNPEGVFSPDAEQGPFGPTLDWDGFFYVNRLIRLYRGVVYGDNDEELVPIGTFMVDKSEVLVERHMSTIVISGSDLWKKLVKSQFGTPTEYAANTTLNTIVADMASDAGVTRINLDPLDGRSAAAKRIETKLVFEASATRGEALSKLCTDMGVEVYFDPLGTLVTKDFVNPNTGTPEWSFDNDDTLAFTLRTVVDDDRLYNHVIVVGTAKAADNGPIFKAELKDNDSGSPTSITRIGDRVFRLESDLIGSQDGVDAAAKRLFHRHFQLSNTVSLDVICNPALEGNDIIKVVELDLARVNRRFVLNTISIPLTTSKQKLTMKTVLDIEPS